MLTEEKINLNYVNFVNKLKKYDCYPQEMEDDVDFNNLLKNASGFLNEDTGGAYEGSLVEHITRIAIIAFNTNKQLHEEVAAPVDSLIKVCYLHQIAKAVMIKKNSTDYESKRGRLFTYNQDLPAVKCGEYSLFLCAKYNIKLNIDEYEAIISTDKRDDDQTRAFGGMLGQLLRMSIELANVEKRARFKYYSNKAKE